VQLTNVVQLLSKEKELTEIIIALAANPEGDTMTSFLKKALLPITQKYSITITVLGRGLSTGTELEYSDAETLKNALRNRCTLEQ